MKFGGGCCPLRIRRPVLTHTRIHLRARTLGQNVTSLGEDADPAHALDGRTRHCNSSRRGPWADAYRKRAEGHWTRVPAPSVSGTPEEVWEACTRDRPWMGAYSAYSPTREAKRALRVQQGRPGSALHPCTTAHLLPALESAPSPPKRPPRHLCIPVPSSRRLGPEGMIAAVRVRMCGSSVCVNDARGGGEKESAGRAKASEGPSHPRRGRVCAWHTEEEIAGGDSTRSHQ